MAWNLAGMKALTNPSRILVTDGSYRLVFWDAEGEFWYRFADDGSGKQWVPEETVIALDTAPYVECL